MPSPFFTAGDLGNVQVCVNCSSIGPPFGNAGRQTRWIPDPEEHAGIMWVLGCCRHKHRVSGSINKFNFFITESECFNSWCHCPPIKTNGSFCLTGGHLFTDLVWCVFREPRVLSSMCRGLFSKAIAEQSGQADLSTWSKQRDKRACRAELCLWLHSVQVWPPPAPVLGLSLLSWRTTPRSRPGCSGRSIRRSEAQNPDSRTRTKRPTPMRYVLSDMRNRKQGGQNLRVWVHSIQSYHKLVHTRTQPDAQHCLVVLRCTQLENNFVQIPFQKIALCFGDLAGDAGDVQALTGRSHAPTSQCDAGRTPRWILHPEKHAGKKIGWQLPIWWNV